MVIDDYFNNPDNLPDYYDWMFLDGFEPWQILEAHRRTTKKRIAKMREQAPEDYNINIDSNVSVKK